jgi:quercetin dioxygenase-like cupin family protein
MLPVATPDPGQALEVGQQFMTGPTRVHDLTATLATGELKAIAVFYEAGARTRPHRHRRFDQILYYAKGDGVVAVDGGPDQIVPEGSLVCLPAGIIHMHGAAEPGPAMHLSILVDVDIDFDPQTPEAWKRFMPSPA